MDAPLIAVVGPTASGKSALALSLAAEVHGEIVSCDSLQVYRGLDIGSAKPGADERARVRHHLLDVVDPDEDFSAADWARLARAAIEDITRRGLVPIVAGGTGLYLRALHRGLFEGPARNEEVRGRLVALAEERGDEALHGMLREVDPGAAGRIEPSDRVRVVRALEVYQLTGLPISEHHRKQQNGLTGFALLTLGLSPDRRWLRQAVEKRTDEMWRRGLLEEVRGLLARGYAPSLRPLRAIGYRQAVALLGGHLSAVQAARDMVSETMRYAKRQMTWFRHQAEVVWHGTAEEAGRAARSWLEGRRG